MMKKYKGTAKTKKLSGIPKMVSNVNKEFPDRLFLI